MLIRGDKLTDRQRTQVLAMFVHRWTHENARRTYGGRCPACVQNRQCGGADTVDGIPWHDHHAPMTTDAGWLAAHTFHFTRDGSRLMLNRRYAEPASFAS